MNTEDTQVEVQEEIQEQQTEVKTFSEEEVQKLIQAESDKRVQSALSKKQQEWQAEQEAKIAEEKRQAQLSEEEKWKEKFDAEVKKFEQDRLEFERAKLKTQTLETLSKEGLPSNFVDFIVGTNAEETNSNIQSLKEEWSKALQATVDEKLKGSTPKSSNTTHVVDKEDLKKMRYSERANHV